MNGCCRCQRINATHQRQISDIHWFWPIIDAAAAYANQLGLPFDRKGMGAVDYRFAFSNPTLLSAPSKKSFSSVSWPILACMALTSTGGSAALALSKTSAARSLSCRFQLVIWLGWISNCCASSASVLSPAMAASHLRLEYR